MANEPIRRQVIVAVADERIRERIITALVSRSIIPTLVGGAEALRQLDPVTGRGVIHTGTDTAALVQAVCDVYRRTGYADVLPVVALVAPGTFKTNWKRGFWRIDDHDAVLALLEYRTHTEATVAELLYRVRIG